VIGNGSSSGSDRKNALTVLKNGSVGIGTPEPETELDIGTEGKLTFSGYTNLLGDGINRAAIYSPAGKSIAYMLRNDQAETDRFSVIVDPDDTGGPDTEAFVVLGNGNVGIGRYNPTEKLYVAGNIYATGSITPGSSRELKENIRELSAEEAVTVLDGLDPQKFYYKADTEDEHVGFIAEDVPELVATKDRKGVSSMDIVAVLTKVVQEQQKKFDDQSLIIQDQQKIISNLTERLNELEREMKLKGSLASVMK
jgi:hypothetical protein